MVIMLYLLCMTCSGAHGRISFRRKLMHCCNEDFHPGPRSILRVIGSAPLNAVSPSLSCEYVLRTGLTETIANWILLLEEGMEYNTFLIFYASRYAAK